MDNSTFSKIINPIKFQYKFEYALMLLFFLALYIDQRVFYITFDLETKRDRSDKSDISRVYYYRNEKWSLYFRGLSPRISRNSNQCTLFKKSNEIKNRGSSQSTNTTPIFFLINPPLEKDYIQFFSVVSGGQKKCFRPCDN